MENNPAAAELKLLSRHYLEGIYNTIVLKDVAEGRNIREIGRLEGQNISRLHKLLVIL